MRFESESKGLVLQDVDGIWATFEGGVFETDDEAVAERLRGVDGITEVAEADVESPTDEESTAVATSRRRSRKATGE